MLVVQGGPRARFIGPLPADGIELTCAKTSTLERDADAVEDLEFENEESS